MTQRERPLVIAPPDEMPAIRRLSKALSQEPKRGCLIESGGETYEIPLSVLRLLQQIALNLAAARGIAVVPVDTELTTQQAAELLNLSRPSMIKLLKTGEIPYMKVGTHRRVRLEDVLNYRERRDETRRKVLAELAQEAQDMGFYLE